MTLREHVVLDAAAKRLIKGWKGLLGEDGVEDEDCGAGAEYCGLNSDDPLHTI